MLQKGTCAQPWTRCSFLNAFEEHIDLSGLLHARVLPRSSSHTVELERELEELREENAHLRETLQDSESRLDRLQDGVVKLQEEYRSESEELQERVEEMTALIEEDESEKAELKIDLEKMTRAKKVQGSATV